MSKAKDEAVKRSTDPVRKAETEKKTGRFAQWFRDLKAELKKVIWPTRKQTVNNTAVSLAVILVSAVVIWGFDKLANLIVQTIVGLV